MVVGVLCQGCVTVTQIPRWEEQHSHHVTGGEITNISPASIQLFSKVEIEDYNIRNQLKISLHPVSYSIYKLQNILILHYYKYYRTLS